MNYRDFLQNDNKLNYNIKKLKEDLNAYKIENEKMKNKINKLTDENTKLKNDLIKANKIILNFNNINQQNKDINKLNEIIKFKDKELNNLKSQLENNKNINVNYNDIIVIHFISSDQKINYAIKCLKTETFAEVEEKLYKKYEVYRETNNNFIAKGKLILRFKKISENNIEDGDKIQLLNIE